MIKYLKKILRNCLAIYRNEGSVALFKTLYILGVLKIKNVFVYPFKYQKYCSKIKSIISRQHYKRMFLWRSNFGWNVPLFQRPQHIAKCLANENNLYFYEVTKVTDQDVDDLKEVSDNLILINLQNKTLSKVLYDLLDPLVIDKYIHFYSTEMNLTVSDLTVYQEKGYHILYEYIDDISPEISGEETVPYNILSKYEYVMKNDDIPVVVTATALSNDVISKRGNRNLVYANNGVDLNHFRIDIPENFKFNRDFQKILSNKKKIIGYYGALAKWFDYNLVYEICNLMPEIDFVLIGKIYDDSFLKLKSLRLNNLFYFGSMDYNILPLYAKKMDLFTIPFLVNDITNATSPLKLYEYMALGKPIITTDMYECRKYSSVNIIHNAKEFVDVARKMLALDKNDSYYDSLKLESSENTWQQKTVDIIELLEKFEKNNEVEKQK